MCGAQGCRFDGREALRRPDEFDFNKPLQETKELGVTYGHKLQNGSKQNPYDRKGCPVYPT